MVFLGVIVDYWDRLVNKLNRVFDAVWLGLMGVGVCLVLILVFYFG